MGWGITKLFPARSKEDANKSKLSPEERSEWEWDPPICSFFGMCILMSKYHSQHCRKRAYESSLGSKSSLPNSRFLRERDFWRLWINPGFEFWMSKYHSQHCRNRPIVAYESYVKVPFLTLQNEPNFIWILHGVLILNVKVPFLRLQIVSQFFGLWILLGV